ncbi:unnamed protein product [Cyprideis torosa]|uniref:Uncharacterized protein n=1 Tax=Cyprideis torosa TaxID=163714 RepID=A0A7R8W3P8_9CRUS|nr:unnamed protein product [Cyprideis torosa]CAG0883276.1 unnamed protein product [Cyprideis torosa]
MSRLPRGHVRRGRGAGKGGSNLSFDRLISSSSNKAIAAKATGVLGKWGNFSCTSLRQKRLEAGQEEEDLDDFGITSSFTKSSSTGDKFSGGTSPLSPSPLSDPFSFSSPSVQQKPRLNKFFKSRNPPSSVDSSGPTPRVPSMTPSTNNSSYRPPSPPRLKEERVPPIYSPPHVPSRQERDSSVKRGRGRPKKGAPTLRSPPHRTQSGGPGRGRPPKPPPESAPRVQRALRNRNRISYNEEEDDEVVEENLKGALEESPSPAPPVEIPPTESVWDCKPTGGNPLKLVMKKFFSSPPSSTTSSTPNTAETEGDPPSFHPPSPPPPVMEASPPQSQPHPRSTEEEPPSNRKRRKPDRRRALTVEPQLEPVPEELPTLSAASSAPKKLKISPVQEVPEEPETKEEPEAEREVKDSDKEDLCADDTLPWTSSQDTEPGSPQQPSSPPLAPQEPETIPPETVPETTTKSRSEIPGIVPSDPDESRRRRERAKAEQSKSEEPSPSESQAQVPAPVMKTRSFFKTRSETSAQSKKMVYKHSFFGEDKESGTSEPKTVGPSGDTKASSQGSAAFDMDDEIQVIPPLRRVVTWPSAPDEFQSKQVTQVKVDRDAKKYFTVIKNVKKAHQIQEMGEFDEFNDDVRYILEGLAKNESIPTRCLSTVSLASKCLSPAFRMHLRAHGTVSEFLAALDDAPTDPTLALCAAATFLVLSQDKLMMDLDRSSLDLMLKLVETAAPDNNSSQAADTTSPEYKASYSKIRGIVEEMQKKGYAKLLDLANISASHLALETLLSLTSYKAGEWFKEELRELGGLEIVLRTLRSSLESLEPCWKRLEWDHHEIETLRVVERCLRVIENVTLHNEANQAFLIQVNGGSAVSELLSILRLCSGQIPLHPTSAFEEKSSLAGAIFHTQAAALHCYVNVSHDPEDLKAPSGSQSVGKLDGVFEVLLYALCHLPQHLPDSQSYELVGLVLTCLLNLTEKDKENRRKLLQTKIHLDQGPTDCLEALVCLYFAKEERAKHFQKKTDDILDMAHIKEAGEAAAEEGKRVEDKQAEAAAKTVEEAVARASGHMGETFTASYLIMLFGYLMTDNQVRRLRARHVIGGSYLIMLFGYLMTDNQEVECRIRGMMPSKNFQQMRKTLTMCYDFMKMTFQNVPKSARALKATKDILDLYASLDEGSEGMASGSVDGNGDCGGGVNQKKKPPPAPPAAHAGFRPHPGLM